MRSHIAYLATLALATTNLPAKQDCRIIPHPKHIVVHGGGANAAEWNTIETDRAAYRMMVFEMEHITKVRPDIACKPARQGSWAFRWYNGANPLRAHKPAKCEARKGAYACVIDKTGCAIGAHDKEGLFNGLQTVLTLIENNGVQNIPCVEISDFPDIPHRAFHVGIGKISPDFIKEVIRRCARCKYNEVYLMAKGSIELRGIPGVFLPKVKQSEVREIVALGKQFNMALIPEIKLLSGFNFCPGEEGIAIENTIMDLYEPPSPTTLGWVKKKRKTKRIKRTFKMENEAVYDMIFSVCDQVYELFDSPGKFHAGLDEGYDFGGSGYDKPNHILLKNHIERLNEYFKKKGAVMCMWGDQLLDRADYPVEGTTVNAYNCHGQEPFGTARAMDLIPKDIVICSWHYKVHDRYPPLKDFKDRGFATYAVPWWRKDNIINMAKEVRRYNLYGLMGSSWSLHMPRKTMHEPGTRPRQEYEAITMTAEAAWDIDNADRNISAYDGHDIMKTYLWPHVSEDRREGE